MAFTLLLRFAGILQSWGTDSRFEIRRTETIPTKSGIIGFLAAALGRRRDEEIDDLADLKIGVRADQPGTLISDFHTARKDAKTSYITNRYYLSDAVFLIGIESDDKDVLLELENAIRYPAYPLFLGRRSCVPEAPIVKEIVPLPLKQALENYKFVGRKGMEPAYYHIFLEGSSRTLGRKVMDQPVSFDFHHRKYQARFVQETITENSQRKETVQPALHQTEQDVLGELENLK